MKKSFSPEQKAAVVLAAIKGERTINQISTAFEVHPTQVDVWKQQAIQGMKDLFSDKRKKHNQTSFCLLFRKIHQRIQDFVHFRIQFL